MTALIVAGAAWVSASVLANLQRLCEQHVRDRYRIQVVDLAEDPTAAREDGLRGGADRDTDRALFARPSGPSLLRLASLCCSA